MSTRLLISLLTGLLLFGCGASSGPDPIDLRQALRLRLIDEALAVRDARKRPTSLDQIQIRDVVISRSRALPSGDYDLWSDYGVSYQDQTTRRSAVVTLTRERGEWRVLSMRAPLP